MGTAVDEMVVYFSEIPAAWNLLRKKNVYYFYEVMNNGFPI